MKTCPVCNWKIPNPTPAFCPQCGWDFTSDPALGSSENDLTPAELENFALRLSLVQGLWSERLEMTAQCQKGDPEQSKCVATREMEMMLVRGGSFIMGGCTEEDEAPEHEVVLNDFYLGAYEVTQAQWQAVMGHNPSKLHGPSDLPVEWISFHDVQEFLRQLNQRTGKTYRLPTEAEWEYACRAGSRTEFCFGDTESDLVQYGWFDQNSGFESHPVGGKNANAWGFYDMHGNVFEWCEDWYHKDFYKVSPRENPLCHDRERGHRVVRGGGWSDKAAYCRSADRLGRSPEARSYHIGVRLACSIE